MSLPDALTPEAVTEGIALFEEGQVPHEFVDSTKFDLLQAGKRYPPKAIAALAAYRQTGELLTPRDFTGGAESKCFRLLRDAGFRVVPKPSVIPFQVGHLYSRKQVGDFLGTTEDTTKGDWATGYHFHRDDDAGVSGWWFLFLSVGDAGRTGHDYHNAWITDTRLQWEGKSTSRIGQPQITSLLSGEFPVLLFTRTGSRDSFTYHGLARAETGSIRSTTPVQAIWTVESAAPTLTVESLEAATQEELDAFVPSNGDERQRVLREIRIRRGQQAFRMTLLDAFHGKCAISGCSVTGVLEAAHIRPYRGPGDNHPSNGLLLRSDLHTLFDLNLLGIEPDGHVIRIHKSARQSPYDAYHGTKLTTSHTLNEEALIFRWQEFLQSSHK